MSMWLEKFVLFLNILRCQIVGKVPVGKVPVDRVCIRHTCGIWGYQFACKIKILLIELLRFLYEWLIMFSLKIISHRRGSMENTQSKHVASVMTCLGICWRRVGPI